MKYCLCCTTEYYYIWLISLLSFFIFEYLIPIYLGYSVGSVLDYGLNYYVMTEAQGQIILLTLNDPMFPNRNIAKQ